ncbi:DUF1828 domain-containing protein [Mesosutterella sp. AGMB02718]|uniref:DUF1828 domain-containing protein n=1 Tax=Mesosutterella faecium TaxID=2925194 RepID=A0ABT7IK72_9BURK|nr:DUF1828 domain-containing protein [Mesosutterella sp. AGMB02718]MDL2058380.1 DUF1828 domain-containing protein [Mesosutterella sp. AGMB02718]
MSLELKTLGFDSYAVPTVDGTPAYEIETPFRFVNEDAFYIFGEFPKGLIRFFDEGMTVHSMLAAGMDFRNGKKRNSLKNFLLKRGVTLLPDGEMEIIAKDSTPVYSVFAKYLKAVLDLDSWARENLREPKSRENFVSTVMHCYNKILPEEKISLKPRIKGLGGKDFYFDLAVGNNRVVDAMYPNQNECAGFALKAAGIRNHGRICVDGIIDDSGNRDEAFKYQAILASSGNVAILSELLKKAANESAYADNRVRFA